VSETWGIFGARKQKNKIIMEKLKILLLLLKLSEVFMRRILYFAKPEIYFMRVGLPLECNEA